jgi:glycosyltransferase involved in cell wall biosynthesis
MRGRGDRATRGQAEHKIAIFDYLVVPTNPAGGCHLRLLEGLCREHAITVFAVKFENPCPDRIRFVRVPAPTRPLALLFLAYHLLVPILYLADRLRDRSRFSLLQAVESNLSFAHVSYVHFCHRAYLKRHWRQSRARGLRGALRWLDHRLHAALEPWVYRRARWIVVPSRGLARELAAEYPFVDGKVRVIPNPVDVEQMPAQPDFDRDGLRRKLGLGPGDIVLVFVALGQFERKGLPMLLEALRTVTDPRLKLIVVGGESDLLSRFRGETAGMGLTGRVLFVGAQRDVRPYFWVADALVLPSFYETFSLVSSEAAAAGLPLIVTPLHGVEDLIRDEHNGFLVEPTRDGVAKGLTRFLDLSPDARRAMGERARRDVQRYAPAAFVDAWRAFYAAAHVD